MGYEKVLHDNPGNVRALYRLEQQARDLSPEARRELRGAGERQSLLAAALALAAGTPWRDTAEAFLRLWRRYA